MPLASISPHGSFAQHLQVACLCLAMCVMAQIKARTSLQTSRLHLQACVHQLGF